MGTNRYFIRQFCGIGETVFFSHIFGVGAFGYKMWTGGTKCFVIPFHIFGGGNSVRTL